MILASGSEPAIGRVTFCNGNELALGTKLS
jgi:hypothetical protein